MAHMKLVIPVVVLVMVMVEAQAQSACSGSVSSLNVCAPFVVPGSDSNPSTECCAALQAVDQDCMCTTLRIASRIPSHCNLPPLSCTN